MSRKYITHRAVPTETVVFWRREYLQSIKKIPIVQSSDNIYIEEGNSKTGYGNEKYSKVLVWNIPPLVTCPGASKWCLSNCYNADNREDVYPIKKWLNNYYHCLNNLNKVKHNIIENISLYKEKKIAFRIHSSGDFFSIDYIDMWIDIINKCDYVSFWAYTRSWVDEKLYNPLARLNKIKNIQLFASWDKSMPTPPDWRKSFVYSPDESINIDNGIICPEQSKSINTCIDCNYCIKNTKEKKDVFFILH